MKSHKGDFAPVMRKYRHSFRFFLLFHLLILPVICHQEVRCFSLTVYIKQRHLLPYLCARHSDIGSNIRLFADDTSLFIKVKNQDTAAELLNLDLEKNMTWAKTWLVSFNPKKTESLLISRKLNKPLHPPLLMDNQVIIKVDSHKHQVYFFSMIVLGTSISIMSRKRPGVE